MSNIAGELYSVKMEIAGLKEKQEAIAVRRRGLEAQIYALNQRIRTGGWMPPNDYRAICSEQKQVKAKISAIENEVGSVKSELRKWYAIEDELRVKAGAGFSVGGVSAQATDLLPMARPIDQMRGQVITLRNTYLAFAEDNTRVNSMRLMAAQFANELTVILREP